MSIKYLEEEILEIEKVKEHFKPGTIEWNNIEAIISEKKTQQIENARRWRRR